MARTTHCTRHQHPRPCPHCAAAGYGGRGRKQGRKAELRAPVRVFVTLEQDELDRAQQLWPGLSKSQTLREAIRCGLGLVEVMSSDIVSADLIDVSENSSTERQVDTATSTTTKPPASETQEDLRKVMLTYFQCRALHEASKTIAHLEKDDRPDKLLSALGIPTALTSFDTGYPTTPDPKTPDSLRPPWEGEISLEHCRQLRSFIRRTLEMVDVRVEQRIRQSQFSQQRRNEQYERQGVALDRTSADQIRKEEERWIRRENGHLRRALKAIPWK